MNKLIKKCPNCGASVEHYYNHKCPYCRTNLHLVDETIKKINNCDIKIDKVYVERYPLTNDYILTILGWSTPKFHYLEEFNNNGFIISGADVGNRVGYKIRLPIEFFYKNDNYEQLLSYIEHSIPKQLADTYNANKIFQEVLHFLHNPHDYESI